MLLQEQIDATRKDIRTESLSMSIGEWISLYEKEEIDIHPEFQRFFRWSDQQKSSFIESILLGIPIPSIFVSQRDDGIWDVVDGLQRLSTIYEFVGVLQKAQQDQTDQDQNISPLALQKTTYLPLLSGKKWDDPNDLENSFTQAQRLLIKRAKIAVNIVEKESDAMIKYELFQRLNTGGSIATPQEVRNCMLLMLNKDLYELMRTLANRQSFKNCIALSDRLYEEQYDMELVLRFILLFDQDIESTRKLVGLDVREFLTNNMRTMALNKDLDISHIERAFDVVFSVLSESAADQSFKLYKPDNDRFVGGFILSMYEVVALGIGYNYQDLPSKDKILHRIKSIQSNPDYQKWSGAGVNGSRRLPHLLTLGRELFSPS